MLKKHFVWCLGALVLCFGFVIPVHAQLAQTGTLNGTTMTEDGSALPGISVTVTSPAMIQPSKTTVSNEKGFFRFPVLPPGKYKVVFQMEGFKTVEQKGVIVSVNRSTSLNVMMEFSKIQETVTVSGTTPTVDKQRATMVSNISGETIAKLPVTRDIDTIFNMVPGVTGDTTHGSGVRDNSYNIDGVNVTDPVIGTRSGNMSLDIVEELSVQTGSLTAEHGGVRGAVVNVVTKSGGNKFSGSASFYFRNKDLQSDNTKGTIFEGQEVGFDYESEPAFTLGGPVIKDKLWFFTSFNMKKSEEFTFGYPFDTQPTNTPLDYNRNMFYGKLSFQAGVDDKVTFSYNFSDYKRNHRGASYRREIASTWKQETPSHVFNLHWTRFWSANFFQNFKAAYMHYNLNLMAKNDLPRMYDYTTRNYTQSYGYDDLYTRTRFQFLSDMTLFVDDWMGRHEIKAGIEVEYSTDLRDRSHNRDARNGLGPYVYTRNNGEPYFVINYQDFGREDEKLAIGGFIQDSWNPTERLSINLGVRIDHQRGIIPKQGEERETFEYGGKIYDPRVLESFTPVKWTNVSPRMGITYDLTGDGKTVLKGSIGRYYAANIMQYFVTVNPNAFLYYRYRLDSNWQPYGNMYSVGGQSAKWMDPNVKAPYMDEISIGVEREIFKDLKVGLRYIRKWDRQLLEDVAITNLDFDALMDGAPLDSVWTNYEPVQVVDPHTGQMVTFYNEIDTERVTEYVVTNPPGAERDYDGIEVTLEKRFANRWMFSASYIYAKSRGLVGTDYSDSWSGQGYFDNPNYHINAEGNFSLERRHQLKVTASWLAPWGIHVSGYYRYFAGRPYTRLINSDDLGLDLNQGDEDIYAEKRGSYNRPGLHILDLRLEKNFKIGKFGRLGIFVDVFNVFNINTMTGVHTYSSYDTSISGNTVKFGEATSIHDPRVIRIGGKFEF